MPPEASAGLDERERPFQFGILGLMTLLFGAAIGLSVANMVAWQAGIPAAAGAWIVFGLINQSLDLWHALRRRTDLSGDQRWGWRFAIFWRLAVVLLLVGQYVVWALLELIDLPYAEYSLEHRGVRLREATTCFCVLIVFASVLPSRKARPRGAWSGFFNVTGVVAGVVFCLLVCFQGMFGPFLVTIAVHGIEAAQPLRFALEGVDPLAGDRMARFFLECSAAFASALLVPVLAWQLIRRSCRSQPRVFWRVAFLAATAISAASLGWLLLICMPRALPIMIEAQPMGPFHVWIAALVLLALSVTVAAYRLASVPHEDPETSEPSWRRNEQRYYHQWRSVIILFAAGMVTISAIELWTYAGVFGWWSEMAGLFCNGRQLLGLTLVMTAVYVVFSPTRRVSELCRTPSPLSPTRFVDVWMTMFLASLVVIPSLALFGFSLWFSPWYRLGWL